MNLILRSKFDGKPKLAYLPTYLTNLKAPFASQFNFIYLDRQFSIIYKIQSIEK